MGKMLLKYIVSATKKFITIPLRVGGSHLEESLVSKG